MSSKFFHHIFTKKEIISAKIQNKIIFTDRMISQCPFAVLGITPGLINQSIIPVDLATVGMIFKKNVLSPALRSLRCRWPVARSPSLSAIRWLTSSLERLSSRRGVAAAVISPPPPYPSFFKKFFLPKLSVCQSLGFST